MVYGCMGEGVWVWICGYMSEMWCVGCVDECTCTCRCVYEYRGPPTYHAADIWSI